MIRRRRELPTRYEVQSYAYCCPVQRQNLQLVFIAGTFADRFGEDRGC